MEDNSGGARLNHHVSGFGEHMSLPPNWLWHFVVDGKSRRHVGARAHLSKQEAREAE